MDAPFVYFSKLTLQKVHVFSDPGPSINPKSSSSLGPNDERHNSIGRPSATSHALYEIQAFLRGS